MKLVHFSDLHYGRGFSHKALIQVVDEINDVEKDIVVFSGDLFANTFDDDLEPLIHELSRIDCDYKYAVYGNHDYKKFAKKNFEKVMKASGFIILKDDQETISIDHKTINIVGTDDFRESQPDIELLHSFNKQEVDYSILIVHEPDIADEFVNDNYDLILSGHTHGGQVKLPYDIRGTTKLGRNYIDGLYELDHDTKLYVSSGLGSAVFRFRFRVKPSITILYI